MISRYMLKCQKASECLKYGKTIWRSIPDPPGRVYCIIFYNLYSTASTRLIHPVHWHYDCIYLCSVTIVDQMCLIIGCKLRQKAPGKF